MHRDVEDHLITVSCELVLQAFFSILFKSFSLGVKQMRVVDPLLGVVFLLGAVF